MAFRPIRDDALFHTMAEVLEVYNPALHVPAHELGQEPPAEVTEPNRDSALHNTMQDVLDKYNPKLRSDDPKVVKAEADRVKAAFEAKGIKRMPTGTYTGFH
jgi:predicted component of type VI protein secretion system